MSIRVLWTAIPRVILPVVVLIGAGCGSNGTAEAVASGESADVAATEATGSEPSPGTRTELEPLTTEADADPAVLAAIDEAEARWLANAPASYTITSGSYDQRIGFGPCGGEHIRVVVRDGQPVQARDISEHCDLDPSEAMTVTEAFAVARATAGAVQEGPEFDETFGFITNYFAADENIEVAMWASNLQPTAFVLADSRQPALDEARARWDAAGIDGYTWTVEAICFCDVPGPVHITVDGGTIVEASVDAEQFYLVTVDDVFDEIQAAIDGDHIEVAYHPELGFPVEVHLDPDVEISDDETTYFAGQLSRS